MTLCHRYHTELPPPPPPPTIIRRASEFEFPPIDQLGIHTSYVNMQTCTCKHSLNGSQTKVHKPIIRITLKNMYYYLTIYIIVLNHVDKPVYIAVQFELPLVCMRHARSFN